MTTDHRSTSRPQEPGRPINVTMGIQQWSMIILLSIFWGGSFFFVEIAVNQLTPLSIVTCRVGIAAVLLLFFVRFSGRQIPGSIRVWGAFAIMGLLNNLVPFSLIVWGQQHISSSLASILNASTPLFSALLAHLLTREERLTAGRLIGILLGWFGVTVLIGVESLSGFGLKGLGQVAVLGAALSYACAAIFGRRFKGLDPVVVSAGMLSASTVMITPVAVILERPFLLPPDAIIWAAVIGLAVVSTALAYIIYFRVLASAGATNLLLVTFLIPVSAIGLGVIVLGEQPGWNAFLGMALIFAGLIAIDGRLLHFNCLQKNKRNS